MGASAESVLIVDDEQLIRDILVRIVEREGYRADQAGDGVEALEKLNTSRFDYVISDIKMPNMDGIELIAQIKKRYPFTKILIVTGQTKKVTTREAIAAGADGFVVKPFKNMEIARTLAELSQKRKTPPERDIPR